MQLSDSEAHAFAQLVQRGGEIALRPVDQARLREAERQASEAFQNWKEATDAEPWARRVNSLRKLAQERAAYAGELLNALRGRVATSLAESTDVTSETLAALFLLYTTGPDGHACLSSAAPKGLHVWSGRGRVFDPVPTCSYCCLRQDVLQERQNWELLHPSVQPAVAVQQSPAPPRIAWNVLPMPAPATD